MNIYFSIFDIKYDNYYITIYIFIYIISGIDR